MTTRYTLDGINYSWSGKYWTDDEGIRPCVATQQQLNAMLQEDTAAADSELTDPGDLTTLARNAMNAGQLTRALRLINRAMALRPTNDGIAAAAVAILRKAHRSDEAIPILQRFKQTNSIPLLVTGAAVLCDVDRWEDALTVIRKALALSDGKSGEAFAVWQRIKSNRPDLLS
jgi:Flp pilus assembly protein TadD